VILRPIDDGGRQSVEPRCTHIALCVGDPL
jgi:hypothetical protein